MTGSRDDRFAQRFRPRVGTPRSGGGQGSGAKAKRFVAQVITAANRAGPARVGHRPGAAKLARGAAVARLIGSGGGRTARRVAVKVRLVNLKIAGPRSMTSHLAYIQRDAVGRDGAKGLAYGRDRSPGEPVDVAAFEDASRDDRHQFRLIVAPEDGEALGDLEGYTRSLMARMEADLGTRLDWVAVDHHDTGHAHSHVVLRGVDEQGRDLVIARDYVAHGMRVRASEIATEWLGPRTAKEIAASLERDVAADRWTGLDRRLGSLARDDGRIALAEVGADERAALRGRLRHLDQLGLVARDGDQWRLSPRHEATLRALGARGDIVRTLQRAMGDRPRELALPGEASGGVSPAIVGRIVAKGLVDELDDRGWLAVDAIDGRAHYLKLPRGSDLASWPVGGIVEAQGGERSVDRTIATAARAGIYTPPVGEDGPVLRERDGAVRRLEALRRAGIVERLGSESWRVPDDLVVRGAAYDRAQDARLILRSPVGLEQQISAAGATWLDRAIVADRGGEDRRGSGSVGGDAGLARSGLGAEVRAAREARIAVLECEGLAERRGNRLLLARNLLDTLEARDLAAAGRTIAAETGLAYRPTGDGRVAGTLSRVVDRPSGRFAMLDDGAGGFALVPWRPVLEHRIGQSVAAVVNGSSISWQLGRSRTLGV